MVTVLSLPSLTKMTIDIFKSKIFIVHYKKMVDRKSYLTKFFEDRGVDVEFLLGGQREDITPELLLKFYKYDSSVYSRNLNPGEIGCAIGHYQGIQKVVDQDLPYAIFFEDDVVFDEDFVTKFQSRFQNFDLLFDLISLGDCCGIGIYGVHMGNGFHLINPPRGRCGYAHILSNRACKILLKNLPFNYPIDWHIGNYVSNMESKFTTLWVDPPLAYEGSKMSNYNSSIR